MRGAHRVQEGSIRKNARAQYHNMHGGPCAPHFVESMQASGRCVCSEGALGSACTACPLIWHNPCMCM